MEYSDDDNNTHRSEDNSTSTIMNNDDYPWGIIDINDRADCFVANGNDDELWLVLHTLSLSIMEVIGDNDINQC